MQKSVITIRPIQAELIRNVEILRKQDPYVVFRLGIDSIASSICRDGGKMPVWNDSLALTNSSGNNLLFVELFDDKIGKDTVIASCQIDLNRILVSGGNNWYDLFYNNVPAGRILMSITPGTLIQQTTQIGSSSSSSTSTIIPALLGNMTIGTENRTIQPSGADLGLGQIGGMPGTMQNMAQNLDVVQNQYLGVDFISNQFANQGLQQAANLQTFGIDVQQQPSMYCVTKITKEQSL